MKDTEWDVAFEPGKLIVVGCKAGIVCVIPNDESRLHEKEKLEAAYVISAAKEMQKALAKAVSDYGSPGGPWNVPNEPGTWIHMARKALAKATRKA